LGIEGSKRSFSSNYKNSLSTISVALRTVLFFYLANVSPINSYKMSALDGPLSAILIAISLIVLWGTFSDLTKGFIKSITCSI